MFPFDVPWKQHPYNNSVPTHTIDTTMLSSHPTPWRNDSHKKQQRLRNPLEPNHTAPELLPQQLVMRERHPITATTTITATTDRNTDPMDQVHGHTSTDSTRYHHHPSYDDDHHHHPFHSSQPEVRSENYFVVLFEHVGAHFFLFWLLWFTSFQTHTHIYIYIYIYI